jgi:hypothetical protein
VYRRLREIQLMVGALQKHLRAALLANNTRDAIGHSGAVHESSAAVLRQIEEALHALESASESDDRQVDANIIRAAERAMSLAVEDCERVALGTNVDEMRDRLINVKTQIDHADAYLRVSLGFEES